VVRNASIVFSFLVSAAKQPHGKRDQRAARQQQLHQQVGTEVAGAQQDLFHASSFTRGGRACISKPSPAYYECNESRIG
jgi:hypothetical protein